MKKMYILTCILAVFAISAKSPTPFPETEITNGIIHARLYLPDSTIGYYRGSRFDWSGVMPELEFEGHSYFTQWFQNYSPTLHDAVMGAVEDFQPVGFDEAKVGEAFLKIGIGMVAKTEEPKYSIATPYKILNGGKWRVKKRHDHVEFTHQLNNNDYSYEYSKVIQLVKGKPEMVLAHTFKNTGRKTIETTVYDHNFFLMDNVPVGPDYVVKFPYNISNNGPQSPEGLGKIQDNQITFSRQFANNDHLYFYGIQGYGSSSMDYDIKIENHKTGAAVRITSDQPLAKLFFWSAPLTLCPEPYINLKVKPGASFNWKLFYQFYICEKTNN